MKNLLSGICAGGLAAVMAVGSLAPAAAMPSIGAPVAQSASDAQLVGYRDDVRRFRREVRRQDRFEDRRDRREARREIRDFERRNDGYYYYRGHRGFRERRAGYRYYNGWYFPSSAFIAGAVITGAINSQARPSGSAHVDWCYNRYRSYRASDNTYQPTNGPRRECVSPY